jgi:glycerol-3-phosphate dehydrogenase
MTPSRSQQLASLGSSQFDVLVIGGGITGAGVARDAAMRGMRVALVEQADFGSGTSSRSSRLVHGGVRYLEHGAVRMVFESSRERRTLLRIAPHLVRPLAFTWPVYNDARIPRWKLRAGLTLYDVLALFGNVGRHRALSVGDVLWREPELRSARLVGGASYWDAATDDARLTLANALDAAAHGATVVNHARVVGITRVDGVVTGAEVKDQFTGTVMAVTARAVVNAAGPWSDRVESMAGTRVNAVRGSKGVHVSVHRSRVGNVSAVTLTAPQDGRVMFVLPAGAFTIIGTTDTFDDSAPEEVRATEADIAYLLASANSYFPEAALTRDDVVSAWAGVRPLASAGAQRADPGSAPREHTIDESSPGLVRVTGGKLTTYRAMASEVVDTVEGVVGVRHSQSNTARVPLPGGNLRSIDAAVREATVLTGDPAVAERFVRAYGSQWGEVWRLVTLDPALGARVTPERPYLMAELRHAVEQEMARTLGDLLIRRTPIAFETMDHGRGAARRIVEVVRGWLEEPAEWADSALAEYEAEVSGMFSVG